MKRSLVVTALVSVSILLPLVGCGSSGASNSAEFNLSQVSYDFGTTLVGTTSTQTVAVLQNTGKRTLSLKPTIRGGTDFALAGSGACGATLAAGQSCNVVVAYAPPAGSSPMQESASVSLGIVGLPTVVPQAVFVTGTPGVAAISLSARSYGFGDLLVGGTETRATSVVTNTGNVALTLTPALAGNADFSLGSGGCAGTLAVGATCNVVVTYAPPTGSSPTQQTATVNLGVTGFTGAETVTVTGTPGVAAISLSASTYGFGDLLVGGTETRTASVVTNTGNEPLTLTPALAGNADFSLGSGGCAGTLAVGATCNVVVTYAPPTGSSPTQQTATVNLGVKGFSGAETVTVTGTPGVPAISLSASTYGFGDMFVGGTQTQTASVVTNTGNVALTLAPALAGNAGFSLGSGGCAGTLAVGATCNVVVTYAPTVASAPAQQTGTVNLGAAPTVTGEAVTVTGTSGTVSGAVSTTANSMVAKYTLTLPFAGTWTVSFGKDTGYGLTTSTVTTTGGATSVFVAGMLPNTTYHMRASVTLGDGQTAADVDHTFASGALPTGIPASFPVTLGTGTPQPGVEVMDPLFGSVPTSIITTDLKGNVIWAYNPNVVTYGGAKGPFIYPVKLISNGDFLMFISPNSFPAGNAGINVMREIDLAGDTVRELSMATLNTQMASAGFPITLVYFSHDLLELPNGHFLIIANTQKAFTNLTGYPGTTNVMGDVVIDLDANWKPDWVWNELDHFDVNRHPWPTTFPDWTHSNSLAYSTDDGDFIISMRHQNWAVKVDFEDGKGTGNVLWKLGEGGDYALQGGVDPTDWFYAQHHVEFSTANTTGIYSLTVMDNGDDRIYPNGKLCGTAGEPACYTTIQELQLNDGAKTATFQSHQILPAAEYNSYGGNVEILANGDFEYGMPGVPSGSTAVYEVTPGSNPQMVWEMTTPGSQGYRTFRLPSLYPGVQW